MRKDFAVACYRDGDGWTVNAINHRTIAGVSRALGQLRSTGPAFGIVCEDDVVFALVRRSPRGLRVFLSDAAVDTALVDEAVDLLDEDLDYILGEDTEDDSAAPAGDWGVLEDLGLSEQLLGVLVDNDELWATDQVLTIAQEVGCDAELERAVGR